MDRVTAFVTAVVLSSSVVASAQQPQPPTFESTVQELASKDPKIRARAAEGLRAGAYPEAAEALAPLIGDPVDDIQMTAIGGELNIFLAQKVTPKKRVALVVERRGNLSAVSIFAAGPSALASRRVPAAVPMALALATADRTLRVAYEALHAFGVLAGEVSAAERPMVLSRSAPMLAALLGSPDPTIRMSALRVVARVYAPRANDPVLDERLGDAVIATLNSYETPVRETAMWALGVLKYDRSVQALSNLMTFYRKGPLAERAFDSISRIGHRANMPQFVEYLNGKNLTFKMLAIEGIGRTGDRDRYASIQTLLKTERHAALMLAGHFANVTLADGPVNVIVDALDRDSLHDQALQYVYELAPGRAAAFGALIRPAKGDVRLEIIDALGLSGATDAIALLQPYADDKDPEVAFSAQRGIARLR